MDSKVIVVVVVDDDVLVERYDEVPPRAFRPIEVQTDILFIKNIFVSLLS